MKQIRIIFLFLAVTLVSSCKLTETLVLVTGDSWAALMCLNKSFEDSFKKQKMPDVNVNDTCAFTTRVGMHAENWINSKYDDWTTKELKNPNVKVVYLSMGGNDFLDKWNTSLDSDQENIVFENIRNDISTILEKYTKKRSDIKIILSGYDFPRFTSDNLIKEYRELNEKLGNPTPLQINSAILRFSNIVSTLANGSNVFYIQHYGLMHYYFGNNENGLRSGTTLPPNIISKSDDINNFGGNINLASDASAMLSVKIGNQQAVDAFHLSKKGYGYLADHVVTMYLKPWFLKETARSQQ